MPEANSSLQVSSFIDSAKSVSKVQEYDPAAFSQIPLIKDAIPVYFMSGLSKVVESIGALLRDSQLESLFGVCLLHRHFDIGSDEKLVEYNGSATPWVNGSEVSAGGSVTAQSWFFYNDKLLPFEYEYLPVGTEPTVDWEMVPTRFLTDLKVLLDSHDSGHLLGLRKYPGDDYPGGVEITQGSTNIVFRPDHVCTLITRLLGSWIR